jgi:hypothetical protein
MRHAMRVLPVSLDDHCRKRGSHLPRLHQHGRDAVTGQSAGQPFRKRACVLADPLKPLPVCGKSSGDHVGICRDDRLSKDAAVERDDTDRGLLQRDVQSGKAGSIGHRDLPQRVMSAPSIGRSPPMTVSPRTVSSMRHDRHIGLPDSASGLFVQAGAVCAASQTTHFIL